MSSSRHRVGAQMWWLLLVVTQGPQPNKGDKLFSLVFFFYLWLYTKSPLQLMVSYPLAGSPLCCSFHSNVSIAWISFHLSVHPNSTSCPNLHSSLTQVNEVFSKYSDSQRLSLLKVTTLFWPLWKTLLLYDLSLDHHRAGWVLLGIGMGTGNSALNVGNGRERPILEVVQWLGAEKATSAHPGEGAGVQAWIRVKTCCVHFLQGLCTEVAEVRQDPLKCAWAGQWGCRCLLKAGSLFWPSCLCGFVGKALGAQQLDTM